MISSGTTAMVTSGDAAVDLIARTELPGVLCTIINEGAVAGFFSVDGGVTWGRLPAGASVTVRVERGQAAVQVKRVAGGANLTGLWAWI